ncbi:beta-glucosidase BglX [Marinoscillum pacificum]|uniref:beta-glucosidase BglX n=1 Tax=Marinoscillum pacificum TaxID=392723 RepID=UPI00215858EA|nr:beta-glucosidase BglX [Marinoscillum pacificum]
MRKIDSIYVIILAVLVGCSSPKESSNRSGSSYDSRIDSLMALMTLEEKVGQLNLPAAGDINTGLAKSTGIVSRIKEGKVGGLFNIRTAEKIRQAQKVAVEETRLGIPLIFGMDVIHGYKTLFPIPLGMSCVWDMDLVEKSARLAASEATADGIAWTFSPMVDVSRDPRWGRISEGSGEDTYLGSQIAAAMVRGYQGDDLTANNTMMACVKHYALYGAAEAGRDYNTVDMSHIRMYNEYFPPYKAAVDAGVGSVMASFNEVDGVPATGSKWLMTEVLRNQWGFDGFVVTDYTGINEMIDHGIGDTLAVAARALDAGIDMDMVSDALLNQTKKAIEKGLVTEAQVDAACRRILEAKFKLGLFDDPYKYCDLERAKTEIFTESNRQVARDIAAESIVLLKNEKGVLPLKKSGKIALIGPMANNIENMAGTWSVAGDFEKSISIIEGLKNAVGENASIQYARGCNVVPDADLESRISIFGKPTNRDERSEEALLAEALKVAKSSDVVVAIIGEASESTGESSSMSNIEIPENQRKMMEDLMKTGKPVVAVILSGRPLAIRWEAENLPTLVNVFFAGSEAGDAIADVLFGDVNPSGKLSATFPQNVGQVPIYYNHKNTGRPLPEGKWFQKFRSNYLDIPNEPVYPFGYGLSYSSFDYSNLTISSPKLTGDQTLKVSVDVTNSGDVAGKEVVQLYIRDVVGSVTRPVKELKGFEKVLINGGETKTVSFEITPEDLKFYNSDLEFVWEPGEFEIMVGTNSRDVLSTSMHWNK